MQLCDKCPWSAVTSVTWPGGSVTEWLCEHHLIELTASVSPTEAPDCVCIRCVV